MTDPVPPPSKGDAGTGGGQRGDLFVVVHVSSHELFGRNGDNLTLSVPVTFPELLRLLRGTVIPPPRRDRAHRLHWSEWRRRHQYRARQAHRRWNAYAETAP